MSLDDEIVNINTMKQIKQIKPIGNFLDGDKFGINSKGVLVYIEDVSTCAGVVKNGLSVDYNYGYKVKPVDCVIPQPTNTLFMSKDNSVIKKDVIEKFFKRFDTELTYTSKKSKAKKDSRSRKKKVVRSSKILEENTNENLISKCQYFNLPGCDCQDCYFEGGQIPLPDRLCDCCENRRQMAFFICESCETTMDTLLYRSFFTEDGVMYCNACAARECCQSCWWDSGGSLCDYCVEGI